MAKTVLIIEDDEGASDLAIAVLKQAGFETALAVDGKQGLAKARELKPDELIEKINALLGGTSAQDPSPHPSSPA